MMSHEERRQCNNTIIRDTFTMTTRLHCFTVGIPARAAAHPAWLKLISPTRREISATRLFGIPARLQLDECLQWHMSELMPSRPPSMPPGGVA